MQQSIFCQMKSTVAAAIHLAVTTMSDRPVPLHSKLPCLVLDQLQLPQACSAYSYSMNRIETDRTTV